MNPSKVMDLISVENQMTDLISSEVARFLTEKAQETARRGRLIFALDATASRQETWDTACQLQAEMFREVAGIGALDVQLVYYRGPEGCPEGECRASRWYDSAAYLTKAMSSIVCRAGYTQIARVLAHARQEATRSKINALVFVGDACEESRDALIQPAADLGRLSVLVFMLQEGPERFPEIPARKSRRSISRASSCHLPIRGCWLCGARKSRRCGPTAARANASINASLVRGE